MHQRIVDSALDTLGRDPLVWIIKLTGDAVEKGLGADGSARGVLGLRGGQDAPQACHGIGGAPRSA